ncbi:hypothetical protein EGI22_23780 [Lacihabitans sp. LS3-19]|uniref:hypothetical protein n=1 Tax=Lacihabitans sp. LS3-19 TaxID=2487335 RepID=UPI0020CB7BCC|nr:hypothetical protein [Lacihabitans sp. LS3-19]MCP9770936.1 hypothetical protein [Lacihabitans sp. LS3-19]
MKVTEKEGEFITLKEAIGKQEKHLKFRNSHFKEKDPVRSQFFGKEKLMTLLNKPNCTGIKILFGHDDKETPSLVLVAADENLKLIAKDFTGLKGGGDDDTYLAHGPTCPDVCM